MLFVSMILHILFVTWLVRRFCVLSHQAVDHFEEFAWKTGHFMGNKDEHVQRSPENEGDKQETSKHNKSQIRSGQLCASSEFVTR